MDGEGRRTRFDPNDFAMVWVDEAHRSVAGTYLKTIEYYKQNPNCKILGVTATPDRLDEKALGMVFDGCAFDYWIHDAIPDGWLTPIKQTSIQILGLDYSSVRTVGGELSAGDIDRIILEEGKFIHAMCEAAIKRMNGRKALFFWPSVASAKGAAEIINRHTPDSAEVIHGGTIQKERNKIYADFASGKIMYLNSVGVCTEGFDEPSCSVVVMARPTKSRALFAQCVGRGMRPSDSCVQALNDATDAAERRAIIAASDKPGMELIDYTANSGVHKLMGVADLLGGKYDDDVVEAAKKKIAEKDGVPADVAEELEEAQREKEERDKQREAERTRREAIKGKAIYTIRNIDPFDLLDIAPAQKRGWDEMPASEKQQAAIVNFIAGKTGKAGERAKAAEYAASLDKADAKRILDKLIARMEHGWCSVKQAALLARYGYEPKGIRREEASRLIDAIANNGWQRPADAPVNEPIAPAPQPKAKPEVATGHSADDMENVPW